MHTTAGNGPAPFFGRARSTCKCSPPATAYSTPDSKATSSGIASAARSAGEASKRIAERMEGSFIGGEDRRRRARRAWQGDGVSPRRATGKPRVKRCVEKHAVILSKAKDL